MQISQPQSAIDKITRPIVPKTAIDHASVEVARHSSLSFATTAIATVAMLASTLSHAQSAPFQAPAAITNPLIINVTKLIPRPVLPIEFFENIKYIFDHDLLLRDDFFDENELKNVFNLTEMTLIKEGRDAWMTSGDFAGPFSRLTAQGVSSGGQPSASILVGKNFTNRSAPDLASLNFSMNQGGPNFEQTEAIFGNGFTYMNPTPNPHAVSQPTTGEHANQSWKQEHYNGNTRKSIIFGFNNNSELSAILLTYPRH
jgi:hypothetical protein